MRKRRQVLQAVTGFDDAAEGRGDAGDASSSMAGIDAVSNTDARGVAGAANAVPEHDHSGTESGGDTLRPAFASIEREPTHALLTEFVEGEGTWEAPYTSESGTGGLQELVDEHGPHTTIAAPAGVYSFTSAFETTTSDIRIIGEGNGHPEHDPAGDEQPRSTLFRLDYRPDDPKKGSIIHAVGAHPSEPTPIIFGWELRNFRITNGTATSFGDERAVATGMRLEWFPVNQVSEITIGGKFFAYGFDRGILVNNMFKFTWADINGKKNRIMIDSDRGVNQGTFRAIYGKSETRSDKPAAMMRLSDDLGRQYNLAAAKPRGVSIVGVGGDASGGTHGLILESAMGVDVYQPHVERAEDSAVLIDVTGGDILSRSVGLYSGFFQDCKTTFEVKGGRDVLIDGPHIQTPNRQSQDTTAVSIGPMSEHTRLRRLSVHDSVGTEVDDRGTGTTRNGMGTVSGSGGPPPAKNWEPGDVVEVRGGSEAESAVYRLLSDGESWGQIG